MRTHITDKRTQLHRSVVVTLDDDLVVLVAGWLERFFGIDLSSPDGRRRRRQLHIAEEPPPGGRGETEEAMTMMRNEGAKWLGGWGRLPFATLLEVLPRLNILVNVTSREDEADVELTPCRPVRRL